MPVQRETIPAICAARAFGLSDLAFEVRDDAVGQFAGAAPIAGTLHRVELGAGLVELFLQFLGAGELAFLGLPLGGQFGRLLFQLLQLLDQPAEPVLRGRVVFLLQRFALDLELHDAAVELVDFLGLRIDHHAQP